ncbi:MAG: pseudouridine synthase [Desulfobulbaceae bacterium]|nr:MAG: pseudouridine synthase [Desulfobulbaceae bacterium]
MEERLQKILARAGICSRRAAEELIRTGQVTVDGQVVTEMGHKVDPRRQKIGCQGRPVTFAEKKVYVMLNKPEGYVTTLHDPQGRPIVTDLLKKIPERLFPVGRLDVDSKGALILTNDGDLAQHVLHPSFEVKKTYLARVIGKPSAAGLAQLEEGLDVEGRRTAPARLKLRKSGPKESVLEITIHEGRKRQVRKMFAAIGHPVTELTRISYGNLKLGSLKPGTYRFLSKADLARIFGTTPKATATSGKLRRRPGQKKKKT